MWAAKIFPNIVHISVLTKILKQKGIKLKWQGCNYVRAVEEYQFGPNKKFSRFAKSNSERAKYFVNKLYLLSKCQTWNLEVELGEKNSLEKLEEIQPLLFET